MRRRSMLSGPVAAVVALAYLASGSVVTAHDPTPTGNKRDFGGADTVHYHLVNNPDTSSNTWFSGAISTSLETNFRDPEWNNSRVPMLAYSPTGAGDVVYSSASSSPCGTGNTAWLQCAVNPSANASWTIYVRNITSSGPSGWTWWEYGHTCSGSATCFFIRRAMIHELGHAMLAFPDMCLNGQPCREEVDTVMNSIDPEVGTEGDKNFGYQRCDEAAAQLDWSMAQSSGEFGNCFDHIPDHGDSGLATNVGVSQSSYVACNGAGVTVSGRLEVRGYTSYGPLAEKPLTGRTLWFDRGTSTRYASTVPTNAEGINWSKTFSGMSNTTYTYTAHFDDVGGDGLASSDRETFTIKWSSAC